MPLYESIGNIVRQIYDMRIEGSSVLGMCLPGARNEMEAESTSGLAVTNAARVGHTADVLRELGAVCLQDEHLHRFPGYPVISRRPLSISVPRHGRSAYGTPNTNTLGGNHAD